jgi:hypothetical protein
LRLFIGIAMSMFARKPSFSKRTSSPVFNVRAPLKPNSIVSIVACAAGSAAGAGEAVTVNGVIGAVV